MSMESAPARGRHASNLPVQATSFVGREQEVAEVKQLLTTTRLLTLTGAGGCGKTRLALQVAGEVLDAYPDGVWLVELASLAHPDIVPQTVALTLGLREVSGGDVVQALVDYLRQRRLCLVLDNCEHLVMASASLVDRLLRGCRELRVLATSREALGVAGETVWRVPSLTVPPAGRNPSPGELHEYESVRLFAERARATQARFSLTDGNGPAVAEICRRLDGIPLAIELAAARMGVFAPEQIAGRLDDRFRLLTAGQRTALPRQQTLQATVDWSYNLLSDPERALLRRLSVFAGDFSFEAAQAVGAGGGLEAHALLDVLAQLVDKSLVLTEEQGGAVRYRLLETIRQYAREKLLQAGEEERTRDQHLAYYLQWVEQAEAKLRGPDEPQILAGMEQEHDNLRAALEWSLGPGRPEEAALRLAGALPWFLYLWGYQEEGLRWLTRSLQASSGRSRARMKALYGAGWIAHHLRDSAAARSLLQESLDIAQELDDRWTIAWVKQILGRVDYFDNDAAAARSLGLESLALAEELQDQWLIAYALHLLGLAAYLEEDYATARDYYRRSIAIRREIGYESGIGILVSLMALVALREGELAEARELLHEAVRLIIRVIGAWGMAMQLGCFAYLAARWRQPEAAARLAGMTLALRTTYGTPMIPIFEPLLAEAMEIARQELGEAAYEEALAAGRAMSLDAAVAEALALDARAGDAAAQVDEPDQRSEANNGFAGLTAAETQVLRLLTTGRTTREIAAELVVAVSTVDRHLTHIYQKLGVRNRAEAVAAALQHGLAS